MLSESRAIGVPMGVVYLVRLTEGVLRLSLGVVILVALAGSATLLIAGV